MENYYEMLEVEHSASKEEIKAAYRRKIKDYHPDTHPGDEYALEMTQLINQAYNTLIDPVKRAEYDDLLGLYARQEASPYYTQEGTVEPEIPHYRCESCGKQDETLRVSVFLYIISLFIVTYKKPYVRILCSSCRTKNSVLANLASFLLGWWGFPFGIIYTLEALYKNMLGGIQPPENNHILLQGLAYDLYSQGRYYAAHEALKASQRIRYDEKVEEFAAYLRTHISPSGTHHSRRSIIGRLKPVFVSGPVTLLCFVLVFLLFYSYEDSGKTSMDYTTTDYTTQSRIESIFAGTDRHKDVIDQYFVVMSDSFESVVNYEDFSGLTNFYLDNLELFQKTDSACIIFLEKFRELNTLLTSKEDIDYANKACTFYKVLREEIYYEIRIASLLKSNRHRKWLDSDGYELFEGLWDSMLVFRQRVDEHIKMLR